VRSFCGGVCPGNWLGALERARKEWVGGSGRWMVPGKWVRLKSNFDVQDKRKKSLERS